MAEGDIDRLVGAATGEAGRQNFREWAGKTRSMLAIAFTDIVDSTKMAVSLGDPAMAEVREAHFARSRGLIARNDGYEVKTIGDSVMAVFHTPENAFRYAQALREDPGHPRLRERVRAGIHVGTMDITETDAFGVAVNYAARVIHAVSGPDIAASVMAFHGLAASFGKDALERDWSEACLVEMKGFGSEQIHFYSPASLPPEVDALIAATEGAKTVAASEPSPPLPDKPAIAVLSFQNMSGDPEQEYFADGMVEEIITALSRIRWLFVIARNSSFTYKGQAVDVKQVGRELGVRYVLEGSVRKAGGRVRITAQLIDAETGSHLWADRFDGALEDVFDLQDQIAIAVAGVIEPTLQAAEVQRVSWHPTNDLTAYDLYLRAYALMLSPMRRISELASLLDQAIERDPDFGPALALAAIFHFNCEILGWSEDHEENLHKGLQHGRRALQVTNDDPVILTNAALALGYFGEDIGAMIALVDRALSLNPGFARGWHASALLRLYAGQTDLAIEHVENSLRLSPRTRVGWGLLVIACAHLTSSRFEEAVPKLLLALQEDATPLAYRILTACYAHMGRLVEARETLNRLSMITTTILPHTGWQKATGACRYRELLLSGLRLAMGEPG